MKSLFLGVFAIASFAATSFGQTIINSVPYAITVPGLYVLGTNLADPYATGGAISIFTSNVTLDLAGHYIVNSVGPNNDVGIFVQNGANVTIQNGIVYGFRYGVRFAKCANGIIQNLRLIGPRTGVSLSFTSGTIVRNNQINGPGSGVPGTGIDIEGGSGNLVNGNVISGFGVCVFGEGGNYFFENMVSNAVIGFDLSGTDKYRFNTTFNCTAAFDGGTAVNAENN